VRLLTRTDLIDLQNPENGQIIQGYFINAYRNLTSVSHLVVTWPLERCADIIAPLQAMIQDLKADSARWDQERRQQSANRNSAGGGTVALNGVYIRSSNTPPVQYRNSDIHQLRQHYGPTENAYASGSSGNDPYDSGPRYPGTGSSGYSGASGAYAQQYAPPQGGYTTQQGYTANSAQFAPPPGNVASYGTGHPVAAAGYGQPAQDPPYNIVGTNLRASSQSQTDPYGNDPYGAPRDPRGDPRDQRVPVTTMASTRATYATAGPSPSQYTTAGPSSSYYPQSATSATAPYPSVAQPGDPFYGRGAYARGL
jgi:hypothetical protein